MNQEDQLDDFVEYISQYVQKPSRNSVPKGPRSEEIDNTDQLVRLIAGETEMKRTKRQRSPEYDGDEAYNEEIAEDLSRLQVKRQNGRSSVKHNSRKTKRRKSGPTGPIGELDMSDDEADTPGPPAINGRASSLQMPVRTYPSGLLRSASHSGTPSDSEPGTPYTRQLEQRTSRPGHRIASHTNQSNAGTREPTTLRLDDLTPRQISPTYSSITSSLTVTPTPNSGHVSVRVERNKREPSFEFLTPAFPNLGLSGRNLAEGKSCSRVKATKESTSIAAAPADRNKPYGSQENPHIIPSTPKSARTVNLIVKDEPRDDSMLPFQAPRHKDLLTETDTGNIKKRQSLLPRGITPGPVRPSSTFGNPTPPSVINQGILQVDDLRVGQSFSQSPSFSEVMRQDDHLFRRNQPKAVRDPTRDPRI